MSVRLTFLGAAQNVTGSCFLVETDDARVVVDCGMYQERELQGRNWDKFPVPPETIDAVFLTHAHLDHCGLLPKLTREGFHGKIYCTPATAEITKIMLMDAGKIQEEDAAYKKKRHEREGRRGRYPEVPLYTREDAMGTFSLFAPVRYKKPVRVGESIEGMLYDAGHVLGSAMVKLKLRDGGEWKTVIFSGDIGQWDSPMLHDPTSFEEADYIVMESTYGDRVHKESGNIDDKLAEVINATVEAGGNVVIPSFALERTQEILYRMRGLVEQKRIPPLMVFLDSPMAISITELFDDYPEVLDEELRDIIRGGESPFEFRGLVTTRSTQDSKAINQIRGTAVIIAGSGMCTGGRIKHHLVQNIDRKESTILFVGYQAHGTLGREIVEGKKSVRILGVYRSVRARIAQISGFSAHADRDDLFHWLSSLKNPPKRVFVTHGELDASTALAESIEKELGWSTAIPAYQETVEL